MRFYPLPVENQNLFSIILYLLNDNEKNGKISGNISVYFDLFYYAYNSWVFFRKLFSLQSG